jgi:trimeric autotransporter adhesin
MTAVVQSATLPSNGTAPTGSVTFNTNPVQTVPLVQGFDPNGNAIATASISVSKVNLSGGSLTGTYNPAANANYTASSATAFVNTTSPFFNGTTTTTFTLTDTNGVTNQAGPYPASDSLTLNIHVASPNADPSGCGFFAFLCSQPTVSVFADGIQLTNSLTVDSNGDATFTLPQKNGYLALPSGQVQIDVIYSGYYFLTTGIAQDGASSSFQTITISDDRTNADFSLQSDTTVNQAAPLQNTVTPKATQAIFNLRLTSLYNFNSAYSTTPIKLTCSVIGYSLAGVRAAVPAGLTCGFGAGVASTVNATIGTAGYTTQTLVVGSDATHSIASNVVPAQPAGRWWLAGGGTTLACIFLLGLPARRRKWQSLLAACVLMMVSFGITGCGATVAPGPNQQYYNNLLDGAGTANGTGPAVTAGTYTVLVTASTTTNTTLVHTLPVQVLVGKNN